MRVLRRAVRCFPADGQSQLQLVVQIRGGEREDWWLGGCHRLRDRDRELCSLKSAACYEYRVEIVQSRGI